MQWRFAARLIVSQHTDGPMKGYTLSSHIGLSHAALTPDAWSWHIKDVKGPDKYCICHLLSPQVASSSFG